jgi:hypothetical protein
VRAGYGPHASCFNQGRTMILFDLRINHGVISLCCAPRVQWPSGAVSRLDRCPHGAQEDSSTFSSACRRSLKYHKYFVVRVSTSWAANRFPGLERQDVVPAPNPQWRCFLSKHAIRILFLEHLATRVARLCFSGSIARVDNVLLQ